MSEGREISKSTMVEAAKNTFDGLKKNLWGIEEGGWGYSFSKKLPTQEDITALIQAGVDYYRARGADLTSHHRNVTEEHNNEVRLTDYERALAYLGGERKSEQGFLKVLNRLGEEGTAWVYKTLGKKPTWIPGHDRESQQIANNQIPKALERIRTVLDTARSLGKPQEKSKTTRPPGLYVSGEDVKATVSIPAPAE